MSEFNTGYFSIYAESAGALASYSATSSGGKHTLRLVVTFASASEMGYAIEGLDRLQASTKAHKSAAKKRPLGLPSPEAFK